jgi:3-oxoacyl-[acyl-carrier protein] reductase
MKSMLRDRVVVITGPAKGMGSAISLAFAEEECRLVLLARDLQAVEPVRDQCRAVGAATVLVACDVTRPSDCAAAVHAAREAFGGRIDALVNVAGGTGPIGKAGVDTTAEELGDIMALNVTGCFNMIQAVSGTMIEQAYGKIVNVGGTFGMRGRAGRMAYSASKWGLRGLTKSLAIELGAHNINVNCVAPGMVDGPRFRDKVCREMAQRLGISEEEAATRHAADYALKRISTAQDVANACIFLASDLSRQITGVDLPVDGGWAAL